jgi:hypothetical protein
MNPVHGFVSVNSCVTEGHRVADVTSVSRLGREARVLAAPAHPSHLPRKIVLETLSPKILTQKGAGGWLKVNVLSSNPSTAKGIMV